MKRNHSRIVQLLVLTLVLGLGMAHPAYAQKYTITNLGTLSGPSSRAHDINDGGQVVGYSEIQGGEFPPTHAFIWSDGNITDLGTLGGQRSYAYSINQAGLVAGLSDTGENSAAFLWESGMNMKNLGHLPFGSSSMAFGINNKNQVTGASTTGSGDLHAFILTGEEMSDLGTLGGTYSRGHSINDSGQVVGFSQNHVDGAHAFLWQNGQMSDLGTLGGSDSRANRINNKGQGVGVSLTAGGEAHAFFVGTNGMIDLGTLEGMETEALGINDLGQGVGYSTITVSGSYRYHAFIWENGQGMQDLNKFIPADSGWELLVASGINNKGQIVGWGYIHGEEVERAFLLTPVEPVDPVDPVEEPKVFKVKINIKPWSHCNKINRQAKWGLVPVAILSSPDFNGPQIVDRHSLTFGRTGDEHSLAYCLRRPSDVNHDRSKDLICYFHVGPTGFQCGDTEGVLKGKTADGKEFEGTDEVQIWPCARGWRHHHKH